jgi:hypothetical protein
MARLVVLKQAVGLASIGLGVAALLAPRRFAGAVGAHAAEPEAIAAFGSRELAAGAALLSPVRFGPFLWLRVAGDVMDLGGLAVAARKPQADHRLLGLAAIAVACMTAFDLFLALEDQHEPA